MSTPPPQEPASSPHDASSASRTVHASDVFRFLRRGAPVALLVAVLAAGVAFIAARNADPVYRATAALLASEPVSGAGDVDVIAPPRVDPAVYRTAMLEGPVVADALERVEGARPDEEALESFLRRLEIDVDNQEVSSVLRIGVEHSDPEYAALMANTIADVLVAWDRDRARQTYARGIGAIEASIEEIDDELAAATDAMSDERRSALLALRNQRVQELGMAETSDDSMVVVSRLAPLRVAVPPERAVGPRLVFDTFVAAVIGLVAAYAFLFARTSLDGRVRSRDDLVTVSGLPVLAEFPRPSRRSGGLAVESAGFFHTNLLLATRGMSPLVLAITSPAGPEEKDGVAVGVAESFSRGGHRTLLIDGDLRRPGTTEGLDVKTKQSAPFEVHLENPDRRYAPATVAIGGKGTFDFIPSFTSASYPVELLTKGLPAQMNHWRSEYDVIIIDATPVLPFADTLAIAPHCTGLVVCARLDETRREVLEESLDLLHRSEASVLGTVLTGVPASRRLERSASASGGGSVGPAGRVDPYRTLGRTSQRPRAGTAERR